MRAREVVLATGAIERPLVFADNDRPGIMLADAARRYLNHYGVKVGERVVVVTAHDSAYRAALELKDAGVQIELIADLRDEATGPLPAAARAARAFPSRSRPRCTRSRGAGGSRRCASLRIRAACGRSTATRS